MPCSYADLVSFLMALALHPYVPQVHRLSAAEGAQLYGSEFKNYEYFTAKHLDATEVTPLPNTPLVVPSSPALMPHLG